MSFFRKAIVALTVVVPNLIHAQVSQMGDIPGDILVMLTPAGDPHRIATDLRTLEGVETGLHVDHEASAPMRIWLLKFTPGTVSQDRMLRAVQQHPMVMMAQNDHPVTFRATPNDPNYGQQWHHPNIDSPEAWDVTTGGVTAAGDTIVVCVVEGANLMHTDLAANRWLNHAEIPGNGIDDDGNGYVDDYRGWNPGGNNDNVYSGGHGTQVAGMIGARGNNGVGVAGANWTVKIMPVTVGSLSQSNVIASYTYPLVMRRRYNDSNGTQGAFVVATNASWGIDAANPNNYPLWCAMYDTLGTEGILNCGATTNSPLNVDVQGDMPTACPSPFMVSVTATNSNNMRTFSGYGLTTIDVGAPGENVYTTSGSSGYGSTSGTSFASPLTAGVIGLLYSAPCATLMALVQSDPEAGALYIREQLFEGVDQVGNLPGQTVTGGRINANNSMELIMNACSGFCAIPGGLTVTATGPTAVNVQWGGGGGDTYDLRYRQQGAPGWTTVSGLTGSAHALGGLAACTSYEFQVRRDCSEAESNWSSTVTWMHPDCCTNVSVVVVTDRYGIDLTWAVVGGGTTYASGGPYPEYGSNGEYPQPTIQDCLPDGCYELQVFDSFGDGLCCNYGDGFVQVQGPGGEALATTPNGQFSNVTLPFCITSQVQVNARVFLDGPYVGPTMSDGLRTSGLIPATEPYTAAGWPQVNGGGESIGAGILNVTGNNAIVDWVRVELRAAGAPATVVATRQALVQRDGHIVDAADGVSPVSLTADPGNYHLVVRHRNHLGVMTANAMAMSSTPLTVDLTLAGTATYGTNARKVEGGVRTLWAGDVNMDHELKYTGGANDREIMLTTVGGTVPTATANGYHAGDLNLDGSVIYTGSGNDRDLLLFNIGGSVPTASRQEQVP